MNLGLQNKNVLITASSKGIGKAIAKVFTEEGSNVAICSRNIDILRKTKEELQSYTDKKILMVQCDLTNSKDIDKLIIIDAVKTGGKPGTAYRFHPHDVNIESEGILSAHELGLEQSLRMIRLTGNEPKETVIIGIEPKEIDWGTELSVELKQKLPQIVQVVLKEIGIAPAKITRHD